MIITIDILLPVTVADGLRFLRGNNTLTELCLRGMSLSGAALLALAFSVEAHPSSEESASVTGNCSDPEELFSSSQSFGLSALSTLEYCLQDGEESLLRLSTTLLEKVTSRNSHVPSYDLIDGTRGGPANLIVNVSKSECR